MTKSSSPRSWSRRRKVVVGGIALLIAAGALGSLGAPRKPEGLAAADPTLSAVPVQSTPTDTSLPTVEVTAEPTPDPTPDPTPAPTPKPAPVTYAKVSDRTWAKIVKSPDNYLGKHYVLYACITQFDAATGDDSFRGDASNKRLEYWFEGDNAFFTGDAARLEDFVTDDIVLMNVTSLGSYSYDTQIGGNTTVPLFEVDKISHKGSCAD